ncbi:hypothetical protein ABTJ49_20620, partial [Acinetobacter baumannii]
DTAIARPIDQAVQLVRGSYPKPSASSGDDPEALHAAIDGRVVFLPESAHGWSPAKDGGEQWFAVDLGTRLPLSRGELAFFSDGQRYAPPTG